MKTYSPSRRRHRRSLAVAIAFACTLVGSVTHAAIDVKNIPLKMSETVQPNVLFILDDSGSMEYLSMPDDEDRSLDEPGPRRCGLFATTACRKADPDLNDHDLAEIDHAMALARRDVVADVVV